jgi:hypothetical protein
MGRGAPQQGGESGCGAGAGRGSSADLHHSGGCWTEELGGEGDDRWSSVWFDGSMRCPQTRQSSWRLCQAWRADGDGWPRGGAPCSG